MYEQKCAKVWLTPFAPFAACSKREGHAKCQHANAPPRQGPVRVVIDPRIAPRGGTSLQDFHRWQIVEQVLHVKLINHNPNEAGDFYAPSAGPSLDLTVPVLHISSLEGTRFSPKAQSTPR
jgi:hypothetical protein